MNDVSVSTSRLLDSGYRAPWCIAVGAVRSSLFQPDGFSLWQVAGELDAGAELTWNTDHGDEGLFVVSGELLVTRAPAEAVTCRGGGVIIVESGAAARVRALTPVRLTHCGAVDILPPTTGPFGPPTSTGHSIHCFSDIDEAVRVRAPGLPLTNHIFCEGTCPTCRIAFFVVDGQQATDGYIGRSHLHSADEIIHMIDGEIRVGKVRVAEGESVAVPANRRYSFRSPGPFRFLNYRRDAATATFAPGSTPILETAAGLTASGVVTPR